MQFVVYDVLQLVAVFGIYLSMATYYGGDFTLFFQSQVQHFSFQESLFDIVVISSCSLSLSLSLSRFLILDDDG